MMAHRYIPTGHCFPRHSLPGNWIGQDVRDLNHCPHGPQTPAPPALSITEGCGLRSSDSYRHLLADHKCYEEYGGKKIYRGSKTQNLYCGSRNRIVSTPKDFYFYFFENYSTLHVKLRDTQSSRLA